MEIPGIWVSYAISSVSILSSRHSFSTSALRNQERIFSKTSSKSRKYRETAWIPRKELIHLKPLTLLKAQVFVPMHRLMGLFKCHSIPTNWTSSLIISMGGFPLQPITLSLINGENHCCGSQKMEIIGGYVFSCTSSGTRIIIPSVWLHWNKSSNLNPASYQNHLSNLKNQPPCNLTIPNWSCGALLAINMIVSPTF